MPSVLDRATSRSWPNVSKWVVPEHCWLSMSLLNKPIRNPVHQLVGGITHAGDTHLREKLGEQVQSRPNT